MPIQPTYHILHKEVGVKKTILTVMAPISDEQEQILDNEDLIELQIGKEKVEVDKEDILCYGDINFDENGTDMNILENLRFLDGCSAMKGEPIPANYDYKTHTCKSKLKCYQTTETWNPAIVCQYAHGCLGKPKKVVIFNYDI